VAADHPGEPAWLEWVRRLASIAQTGLTYATDPYDVERYGELRRLAADMAAAHTQDERDDIERLFAAAQGYPTPKIDVRAAVIVGERILLVREREDGAWSMPGGWADMGDSPAQAAERETREEAGIEVRATKLIALLDRQRHNHPLHPEYSYKAFFACAPLGDAQPRPGSETLDARFFSRAELPVLSLARVLPEQIELAFHYAADPSLPTAFD
jgi:ADP-ribose pyrophosphatase YjhB (NUDIX family)